MLKAYVLVVRSKLIENLEKYHYDQVKELEREMRTKEGRKEKKADRTQPKGGHKVR